MSDVRRRSWWAIVLAVLAWTTTTVPAQDDDALSERDRISLRMVQLAQAGRLTEARDEVHGYLADHPRDGTMLYNLACFDVVLGEHDRALADLDSALACGYTNFRLIDNDRFLNPLREDPRFTDMVLDYELRFREDFQARTIVLDEGYAGDAIPLEPQNDAAAGVRATVRFAFDREALRVTVEVEDPAFADTTWVCRGGSGILVNLIQPLSPDDYESKQCRSTAYGRYDGVPRGAPAHACADLNPGASDSSLRIHRHGDAVVYAVDVPWGRVAPPLDQELGLNVFYLGAGSDAGRPVLALMPEDRLTLAEDAWRRYVPASFYDSDRSLPVMRVRPYETLVENGVLDLEIAIWSATEGPGRLEFGQAQVHITNTYDGRHEPTPELPPYVEESYWERGLNFFNIPLDVARIPAGRRALVVEAFGPDDHRYFVGRMIPYLRVPTDWLEDLNRRIHAIETPEQPILRYRLFDLTRRVETRRRSGEALSSLWNRYRTLGEAVDEAEAGASILPAGGSVSGGFVTGAMSLRSCRLELPYGHADRPDDPLVLAIPPAPGTERRIAENLGGALREASSEAVLLVPQSHGYTGLKVDAAVADTRRVADWARVLFGEGPLTVAGLGDGADAALAFGVRHPEACGRIWIEADRLFAEVEPFDGEHLAPHLADADPGVAYAFAFRRADPERRRVLIGALTAAGFRFEAFDLAENDGRTLLGWITRAP